MNKKDKEIDKTKLNNLIHLTSNLLKLNYVILIVGIILCSLLVFKQLKVFNLFFGILKVISPLFIGFVIAWLFYPLFKKFNSKGINKVLSAILIFLIIIFAMLLIFYIFIPVMYNQVNDLVSYIPNVVKSISSFITTVFDKFDIKGIDISSFKQNFISVGEKYIVDLTTSLPNNIINIVKNLVSGVGIILISLVVAIYMLIDFDNITNSFYKLFKKNKQDEYKQLFESMGVNTRRVVNGTLLVALMVFVFDTIGFAIMGLNASVLLGLLCGLTDLIPYIGPYIGGAAAVIVGFTQGPIIGIGVLIVAIIVQLLESYILQPIVMSKAMKLNPVVIIVGLLVFGYLFGIIGMIIATPCMAIIKEIIYFIKSQKLKKKEN